MSDELDAVEDFTQGLLNHLVERLKYLQVKLSDAEGDDAADIKKEIGMVSYAMTGADELLVFIRKTIRRTPRFKKPNKEVK